MIFLYQFAGAHVVTLMGVILFTPRGPGRTRSFRIKKGAKRPLFVWQRVSGGERGIRTLDRGLTYTPLAGERLQPLGHLSGKRIVAHSTRVLSTHLLNPERKS